MLLQEVYLRGKKMLATSGVESAAFETACLLEFCFGIERKDIAVKSRQEIDANDCSRFFKLALERANGRPLQYILGQWNFMGHSFAVGEGVLIPREDTEVLVRTAHNLLLAKQNPKILELCAGSGIIGLTLARLLPDAQITCVEICEKALGFLSENIRCFEEKKLISQKIRVIQGDLFSPSLAEELTEFDVLLCNPPYIPPHEIASLQKEVQREPKLALDGGGDPDGLTFYRALATNWKNSIAEGGFLAVEVGINQANTVKQILEKNGFENTTVTKDINDIDRVVASQKISFTLISV